MPANRFFFDGALAQGEEILLEGPEDHHLRHVMRVRVGDVVEVVNGRGNLAQAVVDKLEKHASRLRLQEVATHPKPQRTLALGIPLMRPAKLEWVVEKCTELGVDAFRLYAADLGDLETLSAHARERLQHVMIAALKQSGRLYLPMLEVSEALSGVLQSGETVLFGDTQPTAPWMESVGESHVLFATGPERGFSERERDMLVAKGSGIRLSMNVLRAETAPIVAASIWGLRDS